MKYRLIFALGVRALAELRVFGYNFELRRRNFSYSITDGDTQEIDIGRTCRVTVSVVDQSVLLTALEDDSLVYNPNSCIAIAGETFSTTQFRGAIAAFLASVSLSIFAVIEFIFFSMSMVALMA